MIDFLNNILTNDFKIQYTSLSYGPEYEELEDTKGVTSSLIRKSKKDRQHNGQKKRDKRTNNDLQNITQN
jgi:hypothetical protein